MAIRKGHKKGQWIVDISLPPDSETGKYGRVKRTVNGPKSEAEALHNRMISKKDAMGVWSYSGTLQVFIEDVFYDLIAGLSDRTQFDYKNHCRRYIIPSLGAVRLDNLSVYHIQMFVNSFERPGMARKVFATLRVILNKATKMRVINENPCMHVDLPAKERKARPQDNIYSPEELGCIEDLIVGEWWEPLWLVCAYAGTRPEEACALDCVGPLWDGVIRIERAYTEFNCQAVMKPTKTPESKRSIALDERIVARLKYLSTNRLGPLALRKVRYGPYRRGNPREFCEDYRKWCSANNVRYLPPKNLRHAVATEMLESGVDIKTVADILGHSTPVTTANIYLEKREKAMEDATKNIGKKRGKLVEFTQAKAT